MKQIAIVTNVGGTPLGISLCRNLCEVLGKRIEIRRYALDSLPAGSRIEADLVLVLNRNRVLELRSHVAEPDRIQVVQRTVRKREIHRILAIPDGTRVLVVNDRLASALELIALFQQLGISHLQFVPYEEGVDWRDIRVAITPGERQRVPGHVPTVIDVGQRCIDISTFIEVIRRLGIRDPEVDLNLRRYSDSIVTLDRGIDSQYRELSIRNAELAAVMDLSHEGILLVNAEGRITLCNRALADMLQLPETAEGAGIDAFPPEVRGILAQRRGHEWILDCQGRSLVVTRQDVESCGEPVGSYFDFQEVTYIRQLEQNLSRKLRERGQIARYRFEDVLTCSPKMKQCLDLARRVAPSDFTVLVTGESGTGKEMLAQSIHNASGRSKQPFVAVNCAAVPESLLESELFGYQGGAFTGALKEGKAGLFEQAQNGTVFLDEIGDMPLNLQAKLLRVLQERQVVRVGSQSVVSINIRVIAATNQDLRRRIRAGQFREDLFYRLNALQLRIPPLRDRPGDVFLLLECFLGRHGCPQVAFTPDARALLEGYRWPGNIRELANVAGHISLLAGPGAVRVEDLPCYLQDGEEMGGGTPATFAPGTDLGPIRAILELLQADSGPGQGMGRKALRRALAARGCMLSECGVRQLLSRLNGMGLVESRAGRQGTRLALKGRLFLNGLGNGAKQAPIVGR